MGDLLEEEMDIADEIARECSSHNCIPDSQIDALCLSEENPSRNSNSLGLVRTKSGRGASLLVVGEDEHEKVGLIQYDDGCEELRRRQSFHTLESDTFDECAPLRFRFLGMSRLTQVQKLYRI